MDNIPTAATGATPGSTPAPADAGGVPNQATQSNVQIPQQQTYSAGGKTGFSKFIDGITVTDVLGAMMFFATLTLGIVYYRNKIKYMKSDQAELLNQVEQLQEEVDSMKQPQT